MEENGHSIFLSSDFVSAVAGPSLPIILATASSAFCIARVTSAISCFRSFSKLSRLCVHPQSPFAGLLSGSLSCSIQGQDEQFLKRLRREQFSYSARHRSSDPRWPLYMRLMTPRGAARAGLSPFPGQKQKRFGRYEPFPVVTQLSDIDDQFCCGARRLPGWPPLAAGRLNVNGFMRSIRSG